MTQSHHTRRDFLKAMGLGSAALAMPRSLAAAEAKESGKPNIVLIMADDLGYECLGCNGGTSYKTPVLDKLAKSGTRFTNAYCTPLCSPTRMLIMTGRYGFRNYKSWGVLDPKEKTFGHVMKSAGYATCVSGKWQFAQFDKPGMADHCKRSGFDEHCVWTWVYKGKAPARYWDPFIWQNGKLLQGTKGKYGPDIHCDFVIDFIERNKDRPFFAYYPMNLVHGPFQAPPGVKGAGEQAAKAGGKKKARQKGGYYPQMVAYMDKMVGRVVAALDRLKLREKTLIIFTGDNGTPRGIKSKMGEVVIPGGKGTMGDTGTHMPFVTSWPSAVPAGKVRDDLIDFSDIMPTLADLGGADLPKGVKIDGRSFAAQLRGKAGKPRRWVYIHDGDNRRTGNKPTAPNKRAVRDKRWKLYADGKFYDMKKDPFEKSPLASDAGPEGPEASLAREHFRTLLKTFELVARSL